MSTPTTLADILSGNAADDGRYRLTRYDLNRGDWNMKAWTSLFSVIFQRIFDRKFRDGYRSLIPEMILYFSGNESKLLPSDRGIYLSGYVGVGKTALMDTIQEMARVAFNKNYFRTFEAGRIALIRDEEEFLKAVNYDKPALYDDLGSEPDSVKVYGTEILPMVEIIMARYRLFQKRGVPTYFTSNFTIEALEEKYGSRITSRLTEMCSLLKLDGMDMRKIRPADNREPRQEK
jgi:hypothetical protein